MKAVLNKKRLFALVALERLISGCLFYFIWTCNKLTVDCFRGYCFNVLLSLCVPHKILMPRVVFLQHQYYFQNISPKLLDFVCNKDAHPNGLIFHHYLELL